MASIPQGNDNGNAVRKARTVAEAVTSTDYPIEDTAHGYTRIEALREIITWKTTDRWKAVSNYAIAFYPEGFPKHINVGRVFYELGRHPGSFPATLEQHTLYKEWKNVKPCDVGPSTTFPFILCSGSTNWRDYVSKTENHHLPFHITPELLIAMKALNYYFEKKDGLPKPWGDLVDRWDLEWITRPLRSHTRPYFWKGAVFDDQTWRDQNLSPFEPSSKYPKEIRRLSIHLLEQYFSAEYLGDRRHGSESQPPPLTRELQTNYQELLVEKSKECDRRKELNTILKKKLADATAAKAKTKLSQSAMMAEKYGLIEKLTKQVGMLKEEIGKKDRRIEELEGTNQPDEMLGEVGGPSEQMTQRDSGDLNTGQERDLARRFVRIRRELRAIEEAQVKAEERAKEERMLEQTQKKILFEKEVSTEVKKRLLSFVESVDEEPAAKKPKV